MPKRPREKHHPPAPKAETEPPEPIEVVRLEFGEFPQVSRLNPRFIPEVERLKLTLDIHASANGPAAALLDPLAALLPGLRRHQCGDNSRISESTLRRAKPGDAAGHGADVAHLLEHIIIDFQHEIAGMRICSGVTCGYEIPLNRYDIFIESPGQRVSRLCITMACELMNGLLRGQHPDPLYVKIVRLARRIYRNGSAPVRPGSPHEDPQTTAALRVLSELNFIREMDATVNYSRVPLYCLVEDNGHLKS